MRRPGPDAPASERPAPEAGGSPRPGAGTAAVLVVDRTGVVQDVNAAAAHLFRRPQEALRGEDAFALFPADEREGRRAIARAVLESGQPSFFEEQRRRRSFDVAVYPVKDHAGGVVRVAVWIRDVTRRRRTERALRASEERYRALIEDSPDAIAVTDLEGTFVAANQRALALHGCDGLEDLRVTFGTAFGIIVEEDRDEAIRNARRVLSDGPMQFMQYRAYRKDRTVFPIELSASVVRDGAGAPIAFMAITRDASGRRPGADGPAPGPARPPADPAAPRDDGWTVIGDREAVVAEPAMRRVFDLLRTLAGSDLPVLLLGETGCGKEVAAQAIHQWSARKARPFVAVNCAAVPDALVESEFFGYERGAFTGAVTSKPGLLESAEGGTVLLDELGELSPAAQAKLLRALETRRVTRVGGTRERAFDVRIVAATNRDLALGFRKDLLFRLGAAPVVIPPLRERPREIRLLAAHFLGAARARAGLPPVELSPAALAWLDAHPWPGNIRELRYAMEYVAVTVERGPVEPHHLPGTAALGAGLDAAPRPVARGAELPADPRPATPPAGVPAAGDRPLAEELKAFERERILEALRASGWVQREAARRVGMPLRTFQLRLRQFGISTRRRRTTP